MKLVKKGFTLIELLVVIGIIAILMAIVLIAVNPGRQFASARNTQREAHLHAITSVIWQFAAEHDGDLPQLWSGTAVTPFPTSATCIGAAAGCFNLAAAGDVNPTTGVISDPIVATYIAAIPEDPQSTAAGDTGYTIFVQNGRLVATATLTEIPPASVIITITR